MKMETQQTMTMSRSRRHPHPHRRRRRRCHHCLCPHEAANQSVDLLRLRLGLGQIPKRKTKKTRIAPARRRRPGYAITGLRGHGVRTPVLPAQGLGLGGRSDG